MSSQIPPLNTKILITSGFVLVFLFFGAFGSWAALAPLSKGALAVGTIGTDSKSKKVEHLEGGIIKSILVEEGERVEVGQLLFTLDLTRAEADMKVISAQLLSLECREARLLAERDNHAEIPVAANLQVSGLSDDLVQKIIRGEEKIFKARKAILESQETILQQKMKQFHEDIRGLQAENNARSIQQRLINEEMETAQYLIKKRLKPKPEYLELKRRAVDLDGKIARSKSLISRTRQSITESEMRIRNLKISRYGEVVQELSEVQSKLANYREQLTRAHDVLSRTNILAPFRGNIVSLNVNSVGEVIAPGETLMEIVPIGETVVIDARIKPTDIDIVHPGLSAQIRLAGFNQRTTPLLNGIVRQISADSVYDQRTGETYYAARIDITDAMELPRGLILQPGMPAEMLIVSGSRTTLDYLIQPIRDTVSKAMREQ
jgi:HlyD family secretion protein